MWGNVGHVIVSQLRHASREAMHVNYVTRLDTAAKALKGQQVAAGICACYETVLRFLVSILQAAGQGQGHKKMSAWGWHFRYRVTKPTCLLSTIDLNTQ